MYMSNLHKYGHLVNPDRYETNHLHNDLYNLFENRVVSYPLFSVHAYLLYVLL